MAIPTENADLLIGTDNFDFINGLGGNDAILGLGNDDLLLGGDGNDLLVGGRGSDTLNGGTGNDTANFNDSSLRVSANLSQGIARFSANDFSNTSEVDTLLSIENLVGGSAGDQLIGNAAANRISGMLGNDQLIGYAGNDHLVGGDGDDYLDGGKGADTLIGGAGIDTVDYFYSGKGVQINLIDNTASGGDANGDVISGVESIYGSDFADTLTGNSSSSSLAGNVGDDFITGNGGKDDITGGMGHDILSGGGGADTFHFHDVAESGTSAATRDLITDFKTGADHIDLSHVGYNGDKFNTVHFSFVGLQKFSGTGDELRLVYSGANTFIYGDGNGDKLTDFQIEFTGHLTLTATDFIF
ncbi:calcium-binding protein [Aestuariivirga sp.]|uniref:calcium-binding protein n=1 Tax=Aestuariivirga sp. TaxID=2650926 RepID=UPI003593D05F